MVDLHGVFIAAGSFWPPSDTNLLPTTFRRARPSLPIWLPGIQLKFELLCQRRNSARTIPYGNGFPGIGRPQN